MIYEQIASGGCQSYLLGCSETCAAVVIDPEISQIDRYLGLAARNGLRIHYLIDTHTHADHFSGTRQLARQLGVPVVMHRESPAPFVNMRLDDGDMVLVGKLRLRVIHTPGHTRDSMCLQVDDHLFTGDTLLFGGTGRTDLPTGDPEALYDSLFSGILQLDPALKLHPAHDYKGGVQSTIAHELAENPRLQKRERAGFVDMMRSLNLSMPTHVTEALRSNMSGGKTVAQLLAEAAATVPFMSLAELKTRVEAAQQNLIVLDVRERDATRRDILQAPDSCHAASWSCASMMTCRPDATHRCVLRLWTYFDARRGNAARARLSARGRSGWRRESLAGSRLPAQVRFGAVTSPASTEVW